MRYFTKHQAISKSGATLRRSRGTTSFGSKFFCLFLFESCRRFDDWRPGGLFPLLARVVPGLFGAVADVRVFHGGDERCREGCVSATAASAASHCGAHGIASLGRRPIP